MKTNMKTLVRIKSTAQQILNMFQMQPGLLQLSDEAALLQRHAYHISVHHSPFALLKDISDDGKTVWEDGVDSFVELNEEMENVS